MTTTEMMNSFSDPKATIEFQRKTVGAALESLVNIHKESRKATEDAVKRTNKELDAWMKPLRQSAKDVRDSSFELNQRMLELTRDELDRWFGSFSQ